MALGCSQDLTMVGNVFFVKLRVGQKEISQLQNEVGRRVFHGKPQDEGCVLSADSLELSECSI